MRRVVIQTRIPCEADWHKEQGCPGSHWHNTVLDSDNLPADMIERAAKVLDEMWPDDGFDMSDDEIAESMRVMAGHVVQAALGSRGDEK